MIGLGSTLALVGAAPTSSVPIRSEAHAPELVTRQSPAPPVSAEASSSSDLSNSDLARAIVLSKADVPEHLSGDGVVVLRLDCHARAVEVQGALLNSLALEACRAHGREATTESVGGSQIAAYNR